MRQTLVETKNIAFTSNGENFPIPHGPLSLVPQENYVPVAHDEYCTLLKKAKYYQSNTTPQSNFDEQKKKFDEAEQTVARHSGRKKKIWNIIFFLINIGVFAAILLIEFVGKGFQPLIIRNWSAVLVVVILFLIEYFCETLSIGYLIKKSVGKSHLILAFKTNALGRYYDSVTPLATGGQPFQITYLKNREIPLHAALAIPLAKYIFGQISWVIASLICMIISFAITGYGSLMSWVSVVGWILGSAMLIVTIFLSVSKNTGRKILVKVLRLLQRMKIVKNYDKTYAKISKHIEDFQSIMQQYAKSPKDFLVMFGLMLIRLSIFYSIPFFIYAILLGYDWSLFTQFFVTTVMIGLAASFFPMPGGTGMSELSFNAFFASFFTGGNLFWALLIWRFISYYIHLLIGISVITYDFSYGNRKFRWQRRKGELVQESAIFKQEQIDKFRSERNKRRRSITQRF